MRLIVGLGNPGQQYAQTRHNLGFLTLERWAAREGWPVKKSLLCQGRIAKGVSGGQECWLLMPQTFMNLSGVAVRQFLAKQTIDLAEILIVCDDLNLNFGQLRLRPRGSAGGHNGLQSVMDQLGTSDFPRLRMGIGQPPGRQDAADFVLRPFRKDEQEALPAFLDETMACCQAWVSGDIGEVMSQFNKRNGNE